jgi:tetratricopeptide (TPR) repeat protein
MRRFLVIIVAACMMHASPAAAQETPEAQAQKAMETGVDAQKKGDLEAALAAYVHASELVPAANLPHRYAGDVLAELHRWDEAIARYQKYLEIKPNVQDAGAVRARIDEMRSKYIEGVLDVECTPDGAQVTVDDDAAPIGATPLRGFKLRAGTHRLTVRADGYRDGTWSALVSAGATRVVQCSLERVAGMGPLTPLGPIRPEEPPKKSQSVFGTWWFWTGVGVVVAGATVTTFALTQKSSDPPRSDGGTLRFP